MQRTRNYYSIRLKNYKEQTGATYEDIAEAMGVSVASVYNWITGEYEPTLPSQQKIRIFLRGREMKQETILKEIEQEEQRKQAEDLLQIMNTNVDETSEVFYVDSLRVAKLAEKEHFHIIRDIKNYIKALEVNPILDARNYFISSTYRDEQGKERPCYLVTKKGCELIGHKMTGVKGIQFTAHYIEAFHELEAQAQARQLPQQERKPIAFSASDTGYINMLLQEVIDEKTLLDKRIKLNSLNAILSVIEDLRG